MNTSEAEALSAADFEIGDYVRACSPQTGSVDGKVCGIFPPENEVEVCSWVPGPYVCWDGAHVPACSGTVQHLHAGRYERNVFPANNVQRATVEAY
jgi:hypothetical protein